MIAPPKLPSHEEPEALIKEARERQLRRRFRGAAGIAIAAAIGLAIFALTVRGATDRPAGGAPTAGGAPPLCRSAQLSAASYWDGAAGTLINFFTIANRSGTACSLPLARPVVLLRWHDSLLRVEDSHPSNRFGFGPDAKPLRTLAPGRKAAVYMQWSNWCGPPHAGLTTTITLRFRGGLRVAARNVSGQPPCLNRAAPSVLVVSRVLTQR
jgi:hypothetical protein